jgi:hypothetical protein
MGAYEGAFSAEPAAGDHPRGGLGRPGEPVVGSPTRHPVMPKLVVLWEISPLRGGVRPGTRLWAWGPARRSWVLTGPKPKPGGAGGPPGPLRGEARRPAKGYLLRPIIPGVRGLNRPFAGPIEPGLSRCCNWVLGGFVGRQTACWCAPCATKAAGKRCRSGTGLHNGRVARVSTALHKGEGLGEYESTWIAMHHTHQHGLIRTSPH